MSKTKLFILTNGTYTLILSFIARSSVAIKSVFKILELQSGVDDYNVFIDNKWVLSNFSPKNNRLKVTLDKYSNVVSGNHSCRVEISDERKNKNILEFDFKVN